MRILNVIHRYPPAIGGAETWAQEVCRRLAIRGHRMTVMTTSVNKEEEFWREPLSADNIQAFGKYMNDQGVHVFRFCRSLPVHTLYHFVFRRLLDMIFGIYAYGPHSVEWYGRLWSEVKRSDILILHTVPYPHNIVGLVAAKYHGKKVIFFPSFHPGHPSYDRLSNYILMRCCDGVIADSEFERDELVDRGVAPGSVAVAGVGVEPAEYSLENQEQAVAVWRARHGIDADTPLIAYIGRRIEEKGVGTLLRAVGRISSGRKVKLAVAGPPSDWFDRELARLPRTSRECVIDLGLASHVEKVNLLHAADIVALPSKHEAFGIVFLEAWVCGKPVIGTREGAIPEIVGDGGYLCGFGAEEELGRTIAQALDDPADRLRRGETGKSRTLERYTWQTITDKVEQEIRRVSPALKVLIVANAYPPNFIGGAELIAHYQAREISRLGHTVAVFAGDPAKHLPRHSIRHDFFDGLPVWRVALHPEDYSAEFFNFVHPDIESIFEDALDEFSPDIVHLHNTSGLSTGITGSAARRRIKTVMTLHDHWGFCIKNTILKTATEVCRDFTQCADCVPSVSDSGFARIPIRVRKDYMAFQLSRVDRFVTPSDYLSDAYKRAGFPPGRISSIWYGIEVEKYSRVVKRRTDGPVRFTFVGYLGEHKGVEVLIDALRLLPNVHGCKVNIVGVGHLFDSIKAIIAAHGWDNAVMLWGRIDNRDIDRVYEETDVMILPSIWPENQPVTITEAKASGIPVIASRIGGIPEMIADGVDGWLFEPGSATQLAEKMNFFMRSPRLIDSMGLRASESMRNNSFGISAGRLLSLYHDVLGDKGSHHPAPVIAAVGRTFDGPALAALGALERTLGDRVRVVMADWLHNADVEYVFGYWIVDPGVSLQDCVRLIRTDVPVIVDGNRRDLREAFFGRVLVWDSPAALVKMFADALS